MIGGTTTKLPPLAFSEEAAVITAYQTAASRRILLAKGFLIGQYVKSRLIIIFPIMAHFRPSSEERAVGGIDCSGCPLAALPRSARQRQLTSKIQRPRITPLLVINAK